MENNMNKNNKATIEALDGLHGKMAEYFISRLNQTEEVLPPGELSAILKFLKDNEITADIAESRPMQSLIAQFAANEEMYETA
jgi:hypothetical protein